jgi:UDP-N-acetylglucosamine--N-acetylmuramyl-(pentapeptide) pyrophosphoryl-undecaprenol N-acetylglucosamine transferase
MALIWIVAAGTGGHIFPGLSLADELKLQNPDLNFLFFGTRDRLEADIIPKRGYKIQFLKAGRWKGMGPLSKVLGLATMLVGFVQALALRFKSKPVCVISCGGYVSVPVVLACVVTGVPVYLVEPNIRAGLANRLLSRFAKAAFTTPGSDALTIFKCKTYDFGNPVRKGLAMHVARQKPSLIVVLGGSQGAKKLCSLALEAYSQLKLEDKGVKMLLQSGASNFEFAKSELKRLSLATDAVEIAPFVDDVPALLARADIALARAGAMTVTELSAVGLPTVFLPFPFAADDHQRFNARLLKDAGASLWVDETLPSALTELQKAMSDLLLASDAVSKRRELSTQFKKWGRPNATATIAKAILQSSPPVLG